MGSWDGSFQVSGRSCSLALSDPHVPLWNTDADAWNICLYQSLTHRCHMSCTKQLHCSKQRWRWVLHGTFSQTGARRQWEVAPTSFPHMPVMKCKNMFGISSQAKASVFVNSFVLLMGQNVEWNILKISNWATEIEHDAVSEEGQCRWGLKTQHKEFCQMLRRKLNASQLFCLDFPQHEIPIVSIFIYLPVRATCRTP